MAYPCVDKKILVIKANWYLLTLNQNRTHSVTVCFNKHFRKRVLTINGVVGKLVSPVDCKSAALVHCWFKSNRLHQIWLDRIKVITSDCLSDYRGSIPRRVAKFIPQ